MIIRPRAVGLTGSDLRSFQTEADVALVANNGSKQHVVTQNGSIDQPPKRFTPDCYNA